MNIEDVQYQRDRIFEQLEDLSNLDEQVRYQETVAIAQVPNELVNQWFDDWYHPESPSFCECFNPRELALLAEFSSFFEARLESLPDTHDVHELHHSSTWLEIVAKAKEVLERLAQCHA